MLKNRLTGSHLRAMVKLKGSYAAKPSIRPTSTSSVATTHLNSTTNGKPSRRHRGCALLGAAKLGVLANNTRQRLASS